MSALDAVAWLFIVAIWLVLVWRLFRGLDSGE